MRVRSGEAECFRMLDRLRVIRMAVSLGGTETLICHSASTTHRQLTEDQQRAALLQHERLAIRRAPVRERVVVDSALLLGGRLLTPWQRARTGKAGA